MARCCPVVVVVYTAIGRCNSILLLLLLLAHICAPNAHIMIGPNLLAETQSFGSTETESGLSRRDGSLIEKEEFALFVMCRYSLSARV